MKMVLALREKPDQESFQWTRFGKVMFEHCHDRGASEAHANASICWEGVLPEGKRIEE